MFGYDNVHSVTVCFADPGADNTIHLWKVPSYLTKIEIIDAWVCFDTTITQGSGTGVALTLSDYGSTGTAEAGTVVATVGGTATTWTKNVPVALTVAEGTMDASDYLVCKYDETGTVAPLNITLGFTYVSGVGA
jgi:hypothetical protein